MTIQKLLEEPSQIYDCQECGGEDCVHYHDNHPYMSNDGKPIEVQAYICEECGVEMLSDDSYALVLQKNEPKHIVVEVKNGKVTRKVLH